MNALAASLRLLPSVGFVVVVAVLWELAGALGLLPRTLLPPSEILGALYELAASGSLLPAVTATVRRQVSGFLIGATSGVVLGLVAGLYRWAEDVLDTLVSVTYPVPKIAIFPLAVLWLGFSDAPRILIISMTCFYPTFINTLAGTRSMDPRFIWVALNLGVGRLRTLRQVVLRAIMPAVAVGVRISLALSFVLAWATETIYSSGDGVGSIIDGGFRDLQYGPMYAGILVFAVLGLVADLTWNRFARRYLRGQQMMAVGRA